MGRAPIIKINQIDFEHLKKYLNGFKVMIMN